MLIKLVLPNQITARLHNFTNEAPIIESIASRFQNAVSYECIFIYSNEPKSFQNAVLAI